MSKDWSVFKNCCGWKFSWISFLFLFELFFNCSISFWEKLKKSWKFLQKSMQICHSRYHQNIGFSHFSRKCEFFFENRCSPKRIFLWQIFTASGFQKYFRTLEKSWKNRKFSQISKKKSHFREKFEKPIFWCYLEWHICIDFFRNLKKICDFSQKCMEQLKNNSNTLKSSFNRISSRTSFLKTSQTFEFFWFLWK